MSTRFRRSNFKAQLLHEVLRLDVRELLGDSTVAHTEDVGSSDVTALGILPSKAYDQRTTT